MTSKRQALVRDEIRGMWWQDPTSKLDLASVRQKLMEKKEMSLMLKTMNKEDVDKNIK